MGLFEIVRYGKFVMNNNGAAQKDGTMIAETPERKARMGKLFSVYEERDYWPKTGVT